MTGWADWIAERRDVLFVVAIVVILLTIFVPFPAMALDLLLTCSIAFSALILLTAVYVRDPLRFSVFPSALLMMTAFRLALNVATTRRILGRAAEEGTGAAGQVVEAFGGLVAGNEPLIGFVIFAIIMLVNFVVITKGAGRVSEVAARFTLDGMPGKQMSIDAELGAGTIQEDEARHRRERIFREADFYGAMDGASKFVRGDAVAGIVITLINIAAGFALGWLKYGMSPSQALSTFTILTIGDGLVAAVPALTVSIAAGLMVTRASAGSGLGREFMGQFFGHRAALKASAVLLVVLAFTGLPAVPLLSVAAILFFISWGKGVAAKEREQAKSEQRAAEAAAAPHVPEKVESLLRVDPMELEVGAGLIRLADPKRGGGLVERVANVRSRMATDLGVVVPPVRIRDNLRLPAQGYRFKIRGETIGEGTVVPDRILAMDAGAAQKPLEGDPVKEPAFGLKAWWVVPEQRDEVEDLGYATADAETVLSTYLSETLRRHASELLTREDLHQLLKALKETSPAVVEEVVPAMLKPGEVQKVLQNLLREGVSIRDLATILETLGDTAARTRDTEVLTEYARAALARSISLRHVGRDGRMVAITLDPKLEDLIRSAAERMEQGGVLGLSPALMRRIAGRIAEEAGKLSASGHTPVVLCGPPVRPHVKRIADMAQPGLAVLSYNEVVRDIPVEALGMVAVEAAS